MGKTRMDRIVIMTLFTLDAIKHRILIGLYIFSSQVSKV